MLDENIRRVERKLSEIVNTPSDHDPIPLITDALTLILESLKDVNEALKTQTCKQ